LTEAGRFPNWSEANERALVILSMGIGYWLFREGGEFVLCVKPEHHEAVARELAKFEAEGKSFVAPSFSMPAPHKNPPPSLFVFAWLMALVFIVQQYAPAWWMEKGRASSEDILRGEWWRVITALTLHADLAHLAANTAVGALFAAFLLPVLGTGLAWFSVLLGGALGNCLNAWFYRHEAHYSIGASTSVFAALGTLAACQTLFLFRGRQRVRLWEVILPAGAGLAFLAWLGKGDEQTDYMAHFWGFVAGASVGVAAGGFRLNERLSPLAQKGLAVLALALLLAAWVAAA
jgi:membrane associated rhomboid family serine protease